MGYCVILGKLEPNASLLDPWERGYQLSSFGGKTRTWQNVD